MGIICCRKSPLENYDATNPTPEEQRRGHTTGGPRSKHPNRGQSRSGPFVTFAAYTQGGKSDQESQDEMLALHKFGGDPSIHLFCVFDGHGEYGGEVSNFLKRNFPTILQNEPEFPKKPVIALKETCVKANNQLKATGLDISLSGSTGCVCLLVGDQLFTCNVGDSRAIAGVGSGQLPKPLQLTKDHTASNPKEKQRIVASRGRIVKKRIYMADSNLPGLIPSRSFGDAMGARAGVICTPEVIVYTISSDYRFLAIMSDGVWENVAAAHISKHVVLSETLSIAAKEIVKDAERAVHSGNRYRDDMTAVLVELHGYGQQHPVGAPKDSGDDFSLSDDDRLAFAVSICRDLISQVGNGGAVERVR